MCLDRLRFLLRWSKRHPPALDVARKVGKYRLFPIKDRGEPRRRRRVRGVDFVVQECSKLIRIRHAVR
jgi:hypothetical protein